MSVTLPLSTLLALLLAHFVGDFLLQNDRMAMNKSKDSRWLAFHVAVYSACLLPFGWRFALVNYALHFWVDYFSSRASSRLWQAGERHWFFVVVGLDQSLHFACLFWTRCVLG